MNQAELNLYYAKILLAYLWTLDNNTQFNIDLSDVCIYGFDGNDDFYISSWLIPSIPGINPYIEPTNSELLALDLTNCLEIYDNAYYIYGAIYASMLTFYQAITTKLNQLCFVGVGYLAFDLTQQRLVRCTSSDKDGSTWSVV
jgi:hypothetical protein